MHRSRGLRASRLLILLGLLSLALGSLGLRGPAAGAANTPGVSATFTPSTNVADCNVTSVAQPCAKNTVTATGFAPNTRVSLIQCPNSNTIPELCDVTTINTGPGTGYFTDASGNFRSTVVPAYKVPTAGDIALSNDPGFVCSQTVSCVFLVIASTTFDFTQPHAYTNSFTFAAPTGPPANVPEVPWAAVLPLGALGLCGGSYLVLRNRSRSSASAA